MVEDGLRKFNRLLRVLNLLSNPGGITAHRLAEATGVDVRTVYRDLRELGDACFDIQQTRPKGPYKLNGDYSSMGQTLTLEEMLSLSLGCCLVNKQVGPMAKEAMRKLQFFVKGERKLKAREFPDSLAISVPQDQRWIPEVMRALSERKRIRFHYTGGEVGERTVEPYTLLYQTERWYVQGHDPLRGELRRFRLQRMDSLEILEQTFTVPDDYRSESAAFHRWDLSQGQPRTVICRVTLSLAQWLREHPVHPSQILEGDRLALEVADLEAVANWILSLTGIEVLEPAELRQLLRAKAQASVEMYNDVDHSRVSRSGGPT